MTSSGASINLPPYTEYFPMKTKNLKQENATRTSFCHCIIKSCYPSGFYVPETQYECNVIGFELSQKSWCDLQPHQATLNLC